VRVEEEEIHVDGLLGEGAWGRAAPATGFTQREPRPGEPATENTEIRILYTRQALYVGIRALDREPSAIIAGEMGLDSDLFRDDSVVVLIDTFHDHLNAYFFETNPNASRTDALVTDEGRDTNFDWDGVWMARAARGAEGWTAEMEIPFSTLRFEPSNSTWGVNFRRLIRRKNEELYWSPIALDADLFRMSLAGHLTGLQLPARGLNLGLKPFGTATASTSFDAGVRHSDDDTEAGLDVRWGIARGLSLDLTYNTDFAETEVDDLRVNLTRFSLFFPEKREFFLENAGIFEFGLSGALEETPLIKPFFSRRIGLSPGGEEVPIDGGVRLTGRAGRWSLGILDVRTAPVETAAGDVIPENNWAAVRVKRNVGKLSSLGLLFTSRDAGDGDFNRVLGLDTTLRPRRQLAARAFALASDTPNLGDDGGAGGAGAFWEGEIWDWSAESIDIGGDFDPEAGFLLRRGGRRDAARLSFRPRPRDSAVRNWIFDTSGEVFEREDGPRETVDWTTSAFGFRLQNEFVMKLQWRHTEERLFEPFEIHPGVVIPEGIYVYDWLAIPFETNDGARVSAAGQVDYGEWFDGGGRSIKLTLRVRPSRFLRTETDWEHDRAHLAAGKFATNIVRQRLDVSFTPDATASLFAQYNDAADLLSLNARLAWRYRPGSELFLVFDQNWNAAGFDAPSTRDRRITLKLTHLFRL
jgi:hypothetical protein